MTEKADIKELAIATWRLERWLDNLNSDRKMAAKSALRIIKRYLAASDVEVIDPIGSVFDPGLAVEVVNNEAEESDEASLIIIETLTPYVYRNGELISHARVIIGNTVKEAKANNDISDVTMTSTEPESSSEEKQNKVNAASNLVEKGGAKITDSKDEKGEPPINAEDIERMMRYAKIL